MSVSQKQITIQGIIPPLVTPLKGSNELDSDGLHKLIDHVIDGGVHGIFILGTTGELPRLSYSLREETIIKACEFVGNRVPVLVGISDTSMQESLRLGKIASESAADALVLTPPSYYHVEQDELLVYFLEMADLLSLPFYLYNMPSRTNISIDIETVLKAAEVPRILGIKDSSGDLFYLQKLIYALNGRKDFPVIIGPEEIMATSVISGANGGINGGANLFPQLYVNLYKAASSGDLDTVGKLQKIVIHISSTLYQVGKNQPNLIKIIKESLFQMGICSREMAKPYIPFSKSDQLLITDLLSEIRALDSQLM